MPKPARHVINRPGALRFNDLYGKGITLTNNNCLATRTSGFGDAIVFSSRTIRTFEKVFLKHRQKDVDWIGSLRVGFCMHDPKTQFTQETLPNLAFKHLTDKQGYWLRACPDELLRNSPIIYVYYSYDGQIFVGAYGQSTPAQAVLTMNEHNGPYYLFCEVYGKTDQIEMIDPTTLPDQSLINDGLYVAVYKTVNDTVDSKLRTNTSLSQLQYFNYLYSSNNQHKSTFIPTTKHNVNFLLNNRIVCVDNLKRKSSYTFINSPMKVNDVLVCRVMNCDAIITPILLFGLTTIQPNSLQNQNLPDETNSLTEQYSSSRWFIEHDIGANVSMFDELAFWFDANGRTYLSVNNQSPIQLKISIPSSDVSKLTLYPFFDLYGQVTSLLLYDYSQQNKLNFNNPTKALSLCLICCENLADTQFLPCQCVLCHECAAVIKKPSLLSDCPFDRKHIAQVRSLT